MTAAVSKVCALRALDRTEISRLFEAALGCEIASNLSAGATVTSKGNAMGNDNVNQGGQKDQGQSGQGGKSGQQSGQGKGQEGRQSGQQGAGQQGGQSGRAGSKGAGSSTS